MARISESTTTETGIIREEDFSVVMTQAFATYGLSVVTDRALPDAQKLIRSAVPDWSSPEPATLAQIWEGFREA